MPAFTVSDAARPKIQDLRKQSGNQMPSCGSPSTESDEQVFCTD